MNAMFYPDLKYMYTELSACISIIHNVVSDLYIK